MKEIGTTLQWTSLFLCYTSTLCTALTSVVYHASPAAACGMVLIASGCTLLSEHRDEPNSDPPGTPRLHSKEISDWRFSDFEFDRDGNIGLVSWADNKCEFILVNKGGVVARQIAIAASPISDRVSKAVWVGGEDWVIVVTPVDPDEKSRAYRIEWAAPTVTPLDKYDGARPMVVGGIASAGDSGFAVALVQHAVPLGQPDKFVSLYSRDGTRSWICASSRSSIDIAVTRQLRVAALQTLRFGKQLLMISQEPNPCSQVPIKLTGLSKVDDATWLSVGQHDTWIVTCNDGVRSSAYIVNSDGNATKEIEPRLAGDAPVQFCCGVKQSPLGEFWTATGARLYRLSASGFAELEVSRNGLQRFEEPLGAK